MKWIPIIQLVALTTIMHYCGDNRRSRILLELAMPMHTRASSKRALQSLASLFILPAVIVLQFRHGRTQPSREGQLLL